MTITAAPDSPALAPCSGVETKIVAGKVVAVAYDHCGDQPGGSSSTDTGNESQALVAPGGAACVGAAAVTGASPEDYCGSLEEEEEATPVLTLNDVARAFRRLPLPASDLQIQPPDGRTLVNFDTNFFTDATPIHRTITLLGQQVQLRIWADSFTWRFGDGESLRTADPGAPYPALDVTHNYMRTGRYLASVDTTYAAEFRLGGGAWSAVPGTATIDGAGVPLRAIEARPTLVGYGD